MTNSMVTFIFSKNFSVSGQTGFEVIFSKFKPKLASHAQTKRDIANLISYLESTCVTYPMFNFSTQSAGVFEKFETETNL